MLSYYHLEVFLIRKSKQRQDLPRLPRICGAAADKIGALITGIPLFCTPVRKNLTNTEEVLSS